MLRATLAAILAIGLFGPVYADKFDDVRREAQAAFAKLDSDVVELETQRQVEFRLLVLKELAALDLELRLAYGDSLAERTMGLVGGYTDELLADDTASPQVKELQFADFITRVRVAADLGMMVETQSEEPYEAPPPDGVSPSEPEAGEEQGRTSVQATHFTLDQIFRARDEANWTENIQQATVPANKRGLERLFFWRESYPVWRERERQVWTSADGKVTFTVGLGAGPMGEAIAKLDARLDARNMLARIGRESDRVVVAELVGTTPVGYYEYKHGTVLCLMAVPTVLLPKKAER
ncbi:MAG: hypothetical protein WAP55_00805 [Minisyncoccia bacterium]